MFLHQFRRALLQLDPVAVIGLGFGAVEAGDLGVRGLDDRHALFVAQEVDGIEIVAPDIERRDVALAEARGLDVDPLVAAASLGPDHGLEPIKAVDHRGFEVVILAAQRGQGVHDILIAGGAREGVDGRAAGLAVLDVDEDGLGGRAGERVLTDAVDAVEDDARGFGGVEAVEGCEGDCHVRRPCS